jgi:hypothetical protein
MFKISVLIFAEYVFKMLRLEVRRQRVNDVLIRAFVQRVDTNRIPKKFTTM